MNDKRPSSMMDKAAHAASEIITRLGLEDKTGVIRHDLTDLLVAVEEMQKAEYVTPPNGTDVDTELVHLAVLHSCRCAYLAEIVKHGESMSNRLHDIEQSIRESLRERGIDEEGVSKFLREWAYDHF